MLLSMRGDLTRKMRKIGDDWCEPTADKWLLSQADDGDAKGFLLTNFQGKWPLAYLMLIFYLDCAKDLATITEQAAIHA